MQPPFTHQAGEHIIQPPVDTAQLQMNFSNASPDDATLAIEVVESTVMPESTLQEIRDLCTEAYAEDFSHAFELLGPGVHVIARREGRIVSHAMWVERALQAGDGSCLRTAYVEAVATTPAFQRRGFGTRVMRRLASEIRDYDLGALSPSDERFYGRLGWEAWRGPLFIRTATGIEATPDEGVMILRLGKTPAGLDPDSPLSAEWRPGELW
jgi:aminoglycoside 2'-N-acetyltransferase I